MTPLQRLMALFEGNDTHFGTHGAPTRDPTGQSLKWVIRPTARTLKGPTTEKMWKEHVDGKKPLGVVPIRSDDKASWGSIDYDVYGEDLTALIKKVESLKLPLVPGRSKSGGLHLFFFTTEPMSAEVVQNLLRDFAAALGIAGSEIFPKQTTLLNDRGDQGSWMIMPYYGDTFGGKLERQVGLRSNGSEVGLPEFVRIAEKAKQSPDQIDALMTRNLKRASPASGSGAKGGKRGKMKDDTTVPFGDGPPCLVHMVQSGGVPQGGQNDTLCHMATYFKKKDSTTWETELERANQLYMNPPHPESGLNGVIKSYRKKDYEYKCKSEPMLSHCDAILCRKRTHGVSGGGSGGGIPVITSIKKMNSDPPVWFIEVEQVKIECSTEDLQRWERFQRILMEKLHNPFGLIPQGEWLATIQEAMTRMTEPIDVSPDVNRQGEFTELLETYLTNRQRALKEEDLLAGRPWESEDEKRFYFVLSKLHRFLEREGLKGLNKPQLVSRINALEGGHQQRDIKGKKINLHWIPSSAVQATPAISTPPLKERPI